MLIITEGSGKQKGFHVYKGLLVQFLPFGFTACQHTSNGGNNETDSSDTSNNEPPHVIVDELRDQAKDQGANDT
jgi:hypothetical protein